MTNITAIQIALENWMRHEGYRQRVYRCPAGYLTVGYGRNLEAKGLTEEESYLLARNDIMDAYLDAQRVIGLTAWGQLNAARQAVVTEMTANLGRAGLAKFKRFIAACRRGDFADAAAEMLDSLWAEQVGKEPGQRAQRLAQIMRTGDVP